MLAVSVDVSLNEKYVPAEGRYLIPHWKGLFLMKKFIAILVSVMLCACLLAPAASAANSSELDSLIAKLEGFDVSSLTPEDISTIIGVGDMDTVNEVISSMTGSATSGNGSSDPVAMLSDLAGSVMNNNSGDTEILSAVSDLVGFDVAGLAGAVEGDGAFSSILGMLGGAGGEGSSLDVSALTDMISGAFGDSGLDLAALTEGMDLGSFDITSILGGGTTSASGSAMDTTASIMDALTSGLGALGLDTSKLSGLLDTDIVNFFANMFIGLTGDDASAAGTDKDAVVVTPTESAPATTAASTPNTGDTSTVFVAFAVISLAAAAVFVTLLTGKKKIKE